jgi:hypothetical protein
MSKKKTTKEFIEQLVNKFGNTFDYSKDNNINLIHIKYDEDVINEINKIING